MAIDLAGAINNLTVIGSIAGLISFVILFVRFLREKAILNFSIVNAYHVNDYPYNAAFIKIGISIENSGDRGTTIKYLEVLKTEPSKYLELIKFWKTFKIYHYLGPRNSYEQVLSFNIPKCVIEEDKIEFEFDLHYIGGIKKFNVITEIQKREKQEKS